MRALKATLDIVVGRRSGPALGCALAQGRCAAARSSRLGGFPADKPAVPFYNCEHAVRMHTSPTRCALSVTSAADARVSLASPPPEDGAKQASCVGVTQRRQPRRRQQRRRPPRRLPRSKPVPKRRPGCLRLLELAQSVQGGGRNFGGGMEPFACGCGLVLRRWDGGAIPPPKPPHVGGAPPPR